MSAPRVLRPNVRPFRRAVLVFTAIVAGLFVGLAPVGRADAAYQWYDGSIQYSQTVNCGIMGTPTVGPGIGAFVGAYADPQNNMPAAGQPYYVHIFAMAIGNPCAGQIIYMDLILPPGTTPAISAQTPTQCLIDDQLVNGGGCPGKVVDAGGGRYKISSTYTDKQGPWAMPFGRSVEFRLPVVSTQQPAELLKAEVVVIDGSQGAIQYVRPQAAIGIFGGGGGQQPVEPTIVANNPSTTFTATTWPTGIKSEVILYPVGRGGTGWFELYNGPIGGGGTKIFEDGPVEIPANAQDAYTIWTDWKQANGQLPPQLAKNSTYHWRFRYTTSDNATIYGVAQSFRTPGDPPNGVVGSGTPESCSGAELATELTGPQADVTFNCGPNAVVVQLDSAPAITVPKTIEGGGKVTLRAAPNQRVLTVRTANTNQVVELSGLTITGGRAGNGGGIAVESGKLVLADSTLTGNTATDSVGTGGGLLVQTGAVADIVRTKIVNNSAPLGAGVYSWGSVWVVDSEIASNAAKYSGGGMSIQAGQGAEIWRSAILENTAGETGGGIYAWQPAYLEIQNSTLSGNRITDADPEPQFAPQGSALYTSGPISILSSTIANNAGPAGTQAIDTFGVAYRSISGSIVSANTPANCHTANRPASQGGNIESGDWCGFRGAGDRVATDPAILPLGNWGGPTRSHALPANSPAIDTGSAGGCGIADQRGRHGVAGPGDPYFRAIDGNGDGTQTCDAGAVEYQPATDGATPPTVSSITRLGANPLTQAAAAVGSARWTVTFSETVTGVAANDFAVAATGVAAVVTSVEPATTGRTFVVSADVTGCPGSVRLDVPAAATIYDAGNHRVASGAQGETLTVACAGTNPGNPGNPGDPGNPGNPDNPGNPGNPGDPGNPGNPGDPDPIPGPGDPWVSPIGIIAPGARLCFPTAGAPGDIALVNLTPVLADGNGNAQLISSDVTFPPTASNVNFGPATIDPNVAAAPIGAHGKACFQNSKHASVHLIADHLGTISKAAYTLADPSGAPKRLVDTRQGLGGELVGPNGRVCFSVAGQPGDVALVNLTPVGASGPGNGQLVGSDVTTPPTASNVNFGPSSVDPNVAVAPIGADGRVCFVNSKHTSVHLIADHLGTISKSAYTHADPSGAPRRLVDTRQGLGGTRLEPNARVCFSVAGRPGDVALVNLTPVEPGGNGNGQLVSSDITTPPVASNVNYAPGQIDPNVAAAPIGADGKVCFINSKHTSVHLIADHLGTISKSAYTLADPTGAPVRNVDTRG